MAILLTPALLFATPVAAQEEDPCDGPQGIRATVQDDGILVEWEEWAFARAYDVQRAEGDGEFEVIAVTSGDNPLDGEADPHETSYFDADVTAGATYRYQVQALAPPPHMSDVCGSVEATAIPVLPTLMAAAIATVAATGAYAVTHRPGGK